MKKFLLASTFVIATASLVAAFATSASAYPTKTTPCVGCHSGATVPVTATQTSNVGGTAAYSVSAPTATAIAVFDGTTKLFTFTATSGTFSVTDGKTYSVYAVKGPTTSDGLGSTSISPVAPAPPADTVAPVTTSNAIATYVSSAIIKLTATDNVGVTHTYYRLDGGTQVEGTSVTVTALGSHSLAFWSVDAAGNIEVAKTATFTITAPVPVDSVAPVTTSDALATYVSSATIKLTATDNVGVTHTYYRLDGGMQVEGTSVTVTALGSHSLAFWSVDTAGNIEVANTATFTITAPAPIPDVIAPVTTSNAVATYVSSASIKLSATDNVGVAHTYYVLDGGTQLEGSTIVVTALGSHTLSFWSVDAAGNIETASNVTFEITAPVPVADTAAPVTTSSAKASYAGTATINLSATDNVGVAHTYYVLDGGVQVEGTSVTVGAVGSHTLAFWSVDAAGNVEVAHTVTFTITAPAPAPAPGTGDEHHAKPHHHKKHHVVRHSRHRD